MGTDMSTVPARQGVFIGNGVSKEEKKAVAAGRLGTAMSTVPARQGVFIGHGVSKEEKKATAWEKNSEGSSNCKEYGVVNASRAKMLRVM